MLHTILDLFLHLDKHLALVVQQYGALTYLFLFLIIFCETGLVVTPFLPGDSLIFAAAALAGTGVFDPWLLGILLIAAAIIGNCSNYALGRFLGPKVFSGHSRLLNPKHLVEAQGFYERYGNFTIVATRFVPIVRTFAPFVAGIGRMRFSQFLFYNVIGGVAWVTLFVVAGYFFGSLPFVEKNFSLVILGIIFVSLLPGVVKFLRSRRKR